MPMSCAPTKALIALRLACKLRSDGLSSGGAAASAASPRTARKTQAPTARHTSTAGALSLDTSPRRAWKPRQRIWHLRTQGRSPFLDFSLPGWHHLGALLEILLGNLRSAQPHLRTTPDNGNTIPSGQNTKSDGLGG